MTRSYPVERFLQLLDYNPDTGAITWKVQISGLKAGAPAGRTQRRMRIIDVDRVQYRTIDVAWCLYHKRDPSPMYVSPANGDANDLRICNLELTETRRHAARHKGRPAKRPAWHRTDIKLDLVTGLWTAKFRVPGGKRRVKVGTFITRQEAMAARRAFARNYVQPAEESDAL